MNKKTSGKPAENLDNNSQELNSTVKLNQLKSKASEIADDVKEEEKNWRLKKFLMLIWTKKQKRQRKPPRTYGEK
ncbi:hypothetical protein [Solitalea lacus]|uniref:hypothetical protein n=1 Tax=Solitalea lacus TaxID=2911172 RepID=UPI001EDAE027|nr:hypothetical protein [Solitalea lacus]UKJ07150.1 hypothetical protein L2B55_16685 [Solitalea lacus]